MRLLTLRLPRIDAMSIFHAMHLKFKRASSLTLTLSLSSLSFVASNGRHLVVLCCAVLWLSLSLRALFCVCIFGCRRAGMRRKGCAQQQKQLICTLPKAATRRQQRQRAPLAEGMCCGYSCVSKHTRDSKHSTPHSA